MLFGAWLAPIEGLFHSGLETMHARPLPYHKTEQGMGYWQSIWSANRSLADVKTEFLWSIILTLRLFLRFLIGVVRLSFSFFFSLSISVGHNLMRTVIFVQQQQHRTSTGTWSGRGEVCRVHWPAVGYGVGRIFDSLDTCRLKSFFLYSVSIFNWGGFVLSLACPPLEVPYHKIL